MRFVVEVNQPLGMVHHGIALYNTENVLLWGTALNMSSLRPGNLEFVYQLPSLPLKPGPYRWQVSLFDENGLLDLWDCSPDLLVGDRTYGSRQRRMGRPAESAERILGVRRVWVSARC